MSNDGHRTSEIKIKVELDSKNIPVRLKWAATDSEHNQLRECTSLNMSIWDPIEQNSLGIHLWTNDLRIDEMHAHYLRSLLNFTDNYVRATNNPFAKEMMKTFCENLAKETAKWEEEKQDK